MRLQSQRWGSTFVQMKGGQGEIGNSLAKFCWGGFEGSKPHFHVLKKNLGFFLVQGKGSWSFSSFDQVWRLLMVTLRFLYDRSHQRCGFYRHISTLRLRHTQVLVRGGARTPLEPLELLGSEFMEVKSWGRCSTDQGIMQCFGCILNNQYFMECRVCFCWSALVRISRRPESFWRSTLPNDTLLRRHSILNPDGGGDPKTDPTVDQFVELHKFFGKSGLFQYVFTRFTERTLLMTHTYYRTLKENTFHLRVALVRSLGTTFGWTSIRCPTQSSFGVALESAHPPWHGRGTKGLARQRDFNPAGTFGKKWGHRNTFWIILMV